MQPTNYPRNGTLLDGGHGPDGGSDSLPPIPGRGGENDPPLATLTTTVGVVAREAVGTMIGLDPDESPMVSDLVPVVLDFVTRAATIGHGAHVPTEEVEAMMLDTEAIVVAWIDHPHGDQPPPSSHPLATTPIGFADLATQAVISTLDGAPEGDHNGTVGLVGAALLTWIISMAAAQARGGMMTTAEVKALLRDAFENLIAQVVAEMDRETSRAAGLVP
jgi:hypothetical protein